MADYRSLFGLAMYFIIGVVVKKFKFKKEGIEILPNHKFWTVLPYLIKVIFNINIDNYYFVLGWSFVNF